MGVLLLLASAGLALRGVRNWARLAPDEWRSASVRVTLPNCLVMLDVVMKSARAIIYCSSKQVQKSCSFLFSMCWLLILGCYILTLVLRLPVFCFTHLLLYLVCVL